jgi:UDP-glucose 4-epimerase
MKIAITGGAGFIGSHLAKAYLDAGHDVLVIDNLSHGSRKAIDTRARFYHVDIRDEKLRTVLSMERPDLVSHHVSLWNAPSYLSPSSQFLTDADVHVRGLLHVLDSCVNAAVGKIIFASNGNSLYGSVERDQLPLTEDTPLHPTTASDISKSMGEWYVRHYTQHYGLAHTILRYADVYGETNATWAHHPLTHFIQALTDGQRPTIRGTGNDLYDSIFIDDVVQANLLALKHGKNQTLHISTALGYTTNQIYSLVAHNMNSTLTPLYLTSHIQTEAEDISVTLDNTRAQAMLGWQPDMDLFEGVEEAIKRFTTQTVPVTAAVKEPVLSGTKMLARM